MDHFFDYGIRHEAAVWYDHPPPPATADPFAQRFHSENSAFVPYMPGNGGGVGGGDDGRRAGTNKRMMELLRSNWGSIRRNAGEADRGRSYRHMMRERARRENQKQSYAGLHSLLPLGTKSDKNSIIDMARHEIQKLQRAREELRRRNQELEANLMEQAAVLNVGFRVGNPSSGIDSMVEVLKCLKNMELKTTAIHSEFSPHQFSAFVKIQTQIGAEIIEKEVKKTLGEVERKLNSNFREMSIFNHC